MSDTPVRDSNTPVQRLAGLIPDRGVQTGIQGLPASCGFAPGQYADLFSPPTQASRTPAVLTSSKAIGTVDQAGATAFHLFVQDAKGNGEAVASLPNTEKRLGIPAFPPSDAQGQPPVAQGQEPDSTRVPVPIGALRDGYRQVEKSSPDVTGSEPVRTSGENFGEQQRRSAANSDSQPAQRTASDPSPVHQLQTGRSERIAPKPDKTEETVFQRTPASPVVDSRPTVIRDLPSAPQQPHPETPGLVPESKSAPKLELSAEVRVDRTPLAPAREISVRVPGTDVRVDLKITERAGHVQVDVRTPDPGVAEHLRTNVSQLVSNLHQQGYRSEAWHNAEAIATSSHLEAFRIASSAESRNDPGQGDSRQSRDFHPGDERENPSRRSQQIWSEYVERQMFDETQSVRRSN